MKNILIIPIFCFLGIYASNAQSIIGITPTSASQGETLTVDITGQNTNFTQGSTTVWLQDGFSNIYPTQTLINGNTAISCGFTFTCTDPTGLYDLVVDNSIDGLMYLSNVFTLNGSQIQITVTTTDESSVGANDGMAQALVTYGNPPYTYLWNTSAMTSSITSLSPGNYTCNVTDATWCTAGGYDVVQAFQCSLTGTMASTDETSVGANDGTATVTASFGSLPYTYEWSNAATTSSITGLSPGFYYGVTVTDANGCTYSSSAAVNAAGCNLSATATGTGESQAGANDGTAMVTVTGGPTATIVWIPDGETTNFISNLAPGDYTALVTDAATGCLTTATYTVNPGLIVGVFEQPAPVVSVNVYPNPATGFINFEIDGAERAMLYVLDFAGRQVKEIAINQLLTEVNTADLNNGIYFYQLIGMNSDHLGSGKFVIQK